MGWGSNYRNSGICMLRDYAQALNKFETTTPIRRREVECRPLGYRDRPHFSIAKDTDGSVTCYDYATTHKTITFHPDNTVTIIPMWVSLSTCNFIQEVLGISSTQHDHGIKIQVEGQWVRVRKEGVKIRRKDMGVMNGVGAYELVSEVRDVVHHIKRKQANNVRLKYKEFRDYLSGVLKLRGNNSRINDEELKEIFGVETRTYDSGSYEFVRRPKVDYSDRACMDALLAQAASDEPMDKYVVAMTLISNVSSWKVDERATLESFDRCILAHHKDEVFEEIEVAHGALTKDRYGWAFPR